MRRRLAAARIRFGRSRFARRYIAGSGLEIGALDAPFPVPRGVRVAYVDRWNRAELVARYAELDPAGILAVDRVDDGERLATVADRSQDFLIASHVLEHCEDPLGALSNWIRVVRPGGCVVLAVPDARFTFDRGRALTKIEHLKKDHYEGPAISRAGHFREWVEQVERAALELAESRARELEDRQTSIHFHVWDCAALEDLLTRFCAEFAPEATITEIRRNRSENLALLRRS